jgi:solute carrier family 25 S-adenosylmethionine transporter 26
VTKWCDTPAVEQQKITRDVSTAALLHFASTMHARRRALACIVVAASTHALVAPPQAATRRPRTRIAASRDDAADPRCVNYSRRKALQGIAIGALLAPTAAKATFGSSSAAVTSPAPARPLTLDQLEKLTTKKIRQREGAFSPKVVDEILSELEGSVEELNKRTQELTDQANRPLTQLFKPQEKSEVAKELLQKFETEKREREEAIANILSAKDELLKQLEQQREIEVELKKRAAILRKLDAQPAWVSYAAAALASCISTCVMHPVDTIKTRLQATKAADIAGPEAKRQVGGPSKPLDPLPNSTQPLEALGELKELYRGLAGNIVKEAPSSALYLGVYEVVKTFLLATPLFADKALVVYLVAGGVGEFCGSIIRAPAEALKTMTQSGIAEDFGDAARQLASDSKRRDSVVFAWTSSLFRDVPMGAIQIAIFEGVKSFILQSPDIVFDVNTLQSEALLGGLGGLIGAYLTTPTDVLTTRIITDESGELEGMNVLSLGRQVVADGGVEALFEGSTERTLYWTPAIGIFLACYCSLRQFAAVNGLFMG